MIEKFVSERISRRDFLRVARRYGLTSTLLGGAALVGPLTLSRLAEAANSTYEKRFKTPAKYELKFGASGFNELNLLIERAGCLEFVRDLEERTDGAIRIQFIGNNQLCNQLDCVKKTQQGIVDIFAASTQNTAGAAPYYNVLDYAYMFPTRASEYYFLYHPDSEKLFREPLRKMHKLQFLFSVCQLRGIQLGLKWKDKPDVTKLEELYGTKNRVTGTQLGRIAMQLLNLNPVPIAWEEMLDGLKQGLIDGAETWSSAVAYAGMSPVVSQVIDLRFFSGFEHTAMNLSVFDKLGGDLQDAVMESAYFTQALIQGAHEAALVNTVGHSVPQLPNTIFAKHGTRFVPLSDEERLKAAKLCAPEYVPEPWEQWRERINGWAGGIDTYTEIHRIAREIPADTLTENVEARRWWKS